MTYLRLKLGDLFLLTTSLLEPEAQLPNTTRARVEGIEMASRQLGV